jgi:hypothetical protein
VNIIAHRGNISGKNPERENSPDYIMEAVSLGFDAEIDVWCVDGKFYLGHDKPQYEVDGCFCTHPKLWCHAKNTSALSELLKLGAHCFWHENDSYTLTSKMIPWCFPDKWIGGGVTVVFSAPEQTSIPNCVLGICVDNCLEWTNHEVQ